MDNESLIKEIEQKSIYLARQINLIDKNFFNGNKTIYERYDFFDKFIKYALSGKILSASSLKHLEDERLFKLFLDIESLNTFVRIEFPYSYANDKTLIFLNNELKEIVNLFILNNNSIDYKTVKIETKKIDIEVHKSKLKAINLNIDNLMNEIEELDSNKDCKLITKKEKVLEDEKKKKEIVEKDLKDSIQYSRDETKITNAIQNLNMKAEELSSSKNYYEEERENFNNYSEMSFKIAGAMFGLYVVTCYVFYLFNPSSLNIKDLNFIFYLLLVFPIIFPTLLGFLFVRQANIQSTELNKLNDKYIFIHDINQSLRALLEINKGTNISEKTERVIYKLIDNILNSHSKPLSIEEDKNNWQSFNSNIDKTVDTIDKKKSIFNWY